MPRYSSWRGVVWRAVPALLLCFALLYFALRCFAQQITLPQSGPPLPVLTEGAAIAREGNVINASPKARSIDSIAAIPLNILARCSECGRLRGFHLFGTSHCVALEYTPRRARYATLLLYD